MKTIINMVLIILMYYSGHAQSLTLTKEIKIGEKMPNLEIKEVINHSSSIINPSKMIGQLLILDFWATWCSPCVSMLPKIDSLQQKYGNKVKFIGVTREPKETVTAFLTRLGKNKKIRPIVTVVNDSSLSKMFYHATIPYYVWIDETGTVIGTSDRNEINSKNIDYVLSKKKPLFKNRIDNRRKPRDLDKPWFVLNNRIISQDSTKAREEIAQHDMISYSAATHWIDDVGGSLHYDPDRFMGVNVSISFLYRYFYTASYYDKPVWGAFESQKNHSFEIENIDIINKITNKNLPPGATETDQVKWGKKNAVCYEIVFPKNLTWKEKMEYVKIDLDRYFGKPIGFNTHVEKRRDTAYVLRKTDDIKHLTTSKQPSFEKHDRYFYKQTNLPITHMVSQLRSYFFQGENYSFIDSTEIKSPVDLELNCDMTSIASINKELLKYGLKFSKEINDIDVLIFSERK